MDAIDPAAWQAFTDIFGDEEALRQIVATFLQESLELREAVAAGIEADETRAWHRAAHSIKSPARQIGAERLADLAQQIEDAGERGDRETAAAVLVAFQGEVDAVRDELARLAPRL